MNYRILAMELLDFMHPREKRRPPTELEQHERVKDGTIRFLVEHDGVATPVQLTEFFGFSQARVTKILSELEGDGLVLRQADPADRRRVIVHLTEQGHAYALEKRTEMVTYTTKVLEALGEEDAVQLVRIMGKLSLLELTMACAAGKERK